MRALALVDGEHYPPVIRHALDTLARDEGLEFVAAVFLGGTEKLKSSDALAAIGVPVVHEPVLLRGLERALAEYRPQVVVDLSDEPITGYAERFAYAAAALAAGAVYRGADFEFRPPRFEQVTSRPSLAVFGTGKRIGKTAVSGYLARWLRERGLPPVVVAMGRGGPEAPEVVDGAAHALDVDSLLAASRAGRHASSDHFENALLSQVTAVGSRRCGGGLAGAPYVSNVVEAGRVADRLAPPVILFDGSGAAIPPIAVDRRVLVMGAHQKLETLRGYFGPYRIRIADVVLVTMCEPPMSDAARVAEIRAAITAINPAARCIETVFRPRPWFGGPLAGRRVFLALTAPESMGAVLAAHLEAAHGVEVMGVTHALADRKRLREDLARGLARRPDVVLTEIKAASIDVVAEAATAASVPVGFLDNIPVAREPGVDLDRWLETALDLEPLRRRAGVSRTRRERGMSELLVRHGTAVVPFSRGILARSLLQLGLDSTRAYDIATALHAEFVAEGMSLVTSAHLARIVGERLPRHADAEMVARYEKMRLFKRSQRPLVLLIGGSTGSGKSSLATEVAHRLDITRILSTDSVRHVMRAMISERLLPAIHRSSFEAWREPSVVAATAPGVDPTVGAFREQTQHVSVAVEAVLERSVQENLSMILEGVHLVPGLFQRFASDPRIQFQHAVVWVEDEATHRQRFVARGQGARERPGRRYLDNFDAIRTIQAHLVERARAERLPVIENRDFDAALFAFLGRILDGVGDSTPVVLDAPAALSRGTRTKS